MTKTPLKEKIIATFYQLKNDKQQHFYLSGRGFSVSEHVG
jgi:hypothetical protein